MFVALLVNPFILVMLTMTMSLCVKNYSIGVKFIKIFSVIHTLATLIKAQMGEREQPLSSLFQYISDERERVFIVRRSRA